MAVVQRIVQTLPSRLVPPSRGALHLWSAATNQDLDPVIAAHQTSTFLALLSPDEQARSQRYIIAKARQQFIETRGLLRLLLAAYLQQDPASLVFVYSDNGKPALAPQSGGALLQFNVSHSQGQVLYGVRTDQAVGVDIEGINPLISYLEIARRICTAQELAVFNQLPQGEQSQAFFKIWTRKEALVKLFGDRLYEKLSIFEVPAHATSGGYWVQAENRQIWLQDLALGVSFAGAIATLDRPQSIDQHHWDWTLS